MGKVKVDSDPTNDYDDGYNAGRRYQKNLTKENNMAQAVTPEVSPVLETLKFVVRLGLLVGVPILISNVANLSGTWQTAFATVLPIVLPIVDKWVHEDTRIPAKGLLPF